MRKEEKITTFACPKLAIKWGCLLLLRLLFCAAIVFLLFKYNHMAVATICTNILLAFLFLESFASVRKCGYGVALFKCFIVTTADKNGISNRFCRINREEICYVGYEHIYANHLNSRYYIRGDFGMVAIISKSEEEKGKAFSEYSVKETVCLPLTDDIKLLLQEWDKLKIEK